MTYNKDQETIDSVFSTLASKTDDIERALRRVNSAKQDLEKQKLKLEMKLDRLAVDLNLFEEISAGLQGQLHDSQSAMNALTQFSRRLSTRELNKTLQNADVGFEEGEVD